MTLIDLNTLSAAEVRDPLLSCCGSESWLSEMLARRPFQDMATMHAEADEAWWRLDERDWLEAFSKHPQIGEQKEDAKWSAAEQAGMARASTDAVASMYQLNRKYLEKFGWIFIVCATGKSAAEMLAIIEQRLANNAAREIRIAAAEQAKITHLRLTKLLAE
jgi:2-oxo-4-hydroxy-4-carboxy-5-ureidoimidazoline decarboxylase